MNIALEKKNILQWIQKLDDEKIKYPHTNIN